MKKINSYKVLCEPLHRILNLKILSSKKIEILERKLRNIILASTPKTPVILEYTQCVVGHVLMEEDIKHINKLILDIVKGKGDSSEATKTVLVSAYNSIVSIYDSLDIDLICASLNGFPPVSLEKPKHMEDKNFEASLEKEVSKKKTKSDPGINNLKDLNDLSEFLNTRIIGQKEAVNSVCESLKLKMAGFSVTTNLFFIGKSGVGKTELARLLGERYSGNFWVIGCNEFQHGHEINKLMGSPPGYIGHSDTSLIKQKAQKSSKWVILFDEIEKANDKLFNLLLGLMETGRCVDNIGTEIDLRDSIFIFTSNCGIRDLKSTSTNFHNSNNETSDKEYLKESLKDKFSPEFRNRLDEIVFFNDLTKEDALKIAKLRLKKYPIDVDSSLLEYIVTNSFSKEFGAREVDRFIKKKVALPLADIVLSTTKSKSKTFKVSVLDNKVVIE
jgi:ATP-dependent Clp protease ATP-binding subunit ClpA